MKEYHKIQTVWKRDLANNSKTLIEGDWSLPEFEFLALNDWVFTEKVDGTNIRVMIMPFAEGSIVPGVMFGGKTDNAQIPANLVKRLEERFLPQKEQLYEMFADGACLYGEGYGAKIQKVGGLYRPDQDFVLFDVKVGEWWLNRESVELIAAKLGLDVVPIVGRGTLYKMVDLARAGMRSRWGDFLSEGLVARPTVELKTRSGHRLITKIKTKDFAPVAMAKAA